MINKSKFRFEMLMISVLFFVVAGMLIIIYSSTYLEISKENKEMLEIYAIGYSHNGIPTQEMVKPKISAEDINGNTNQRFQVSDFYAVAYDLNGYVTGIDNSVSSGINNEQLIKIANIMKNKNREYGSYNNYVYLVDNTENYTLVVMIDNTIINGITNTMARYILIVGCVAIFLLIIFSKLLMKWVMQPVSEGYQKQKQFVADAGHELKTPISAIEANATLLSREIGENNWLKNITYENKRMSDMVRELLDLARLENVVLDLKTIDLSNIIFSAALPFEARAYEHGITIKYDLPEILEIKGDKQQLEKLISILVDNAISHTKTSGEIVIKAYQAKGKKYFCVSNPGDEIPLENRDKIFERFYRLDKSRGHEERHYGLGLAIAKNIIILHKGDIKVDCRDGMVSFIVTL